MPVFVTITDADISNPAFWAGLNIDSNSTIDASGISGSFQITMTGNSISFTDSGTMITTTYSDGDLLGGSFSQFVQYIGNDAGNVVSGSVGLNAGGYTGGTGGDILTDSGSLGGALNGDDGDDILTGGVGNNEIYGGDGEDLLLGGSGNNNLYGDDGDDTLYGEDGSGNLDGGSGDDVIYAGLNTTFVEGGSGSNTLYVPAGSTVTPFFPGSTGGSVTTPSGSFVYLDIENVFIACFTQGSRIQTPDGDIAAEHLKIGDLVDTLDHGPQPIRWIGKRTVPGTGVHAPICFSPNSIGNKTYFRVSPQHRILFSGWKCELLFGAPEIICAAKHLCDGDQIYADPCDEVTYFHIMFDRHEIIFCEGATSESFFVGDYVANADPETLAELVELFPELAQSSHGGQQAVRPQAKGFESTLLQPSVS